MKKIKTETIIALCSLSGVFFLFSAFLFDGSTTTMILLAGLVAAVSAVTAILWRYKDRITMRLGQNAKRILGGFSLICSVLFSTVLIVHASSATGTLETGGAKFYISASTDSDADVENDSDKRAEPSVKCNADGTATITLTGYTDCDGDQSATYTITITNKTTFDDGSAKGVAFTLEVKEGVTVKSTTDYPSDTTTVTIQDLQSGSGKNGTKTITLTFTNVTPDKGTEQVTTTFKDGIGGSYTVDGIAHGESATNVDGTEYVLVATPDSGYSFYGWMSNQGPLNLTNNTYVSAGSNTIWPVFRKIATADLPESAIYYIRNASPVVYYSHLDEANTAANGSGTIVVHESGTVYHSNTNTKTITIDAGVKLLVPYSDVDTGKFKESAAILETSAASSSANKKLTIPNNTELIMNGDMCVNSAVGAPGSGDTGHPTGKYGYVLLEGSNSKITVNGSLTVYGYISGSGMVHATSTARVYEAFQLRDWRGGSATMTWYGILSRKTKSFIVNEYYIQNIESKYRVDSGALSYICATMTMAGVGSQQATAVYIGSGGLFQLGEDSYVIREYNASEDRIYYDLYGTVTTAGIDLQVSTYQLNTANFILGIHHSMTITVKGTDPDGNTINSSASVTKAFKLLPGAELVIEKNGTLTVDPSTTLYLYDAGDWLDTTYLYFAHLGNDLNAAKKTQTVKYSTSTKGSRSVHGSAKLQVDGTLIGNSNIFTTTHGSTQPDKVITGTGIFTNNAAASNYSRMDLDEIKNNNPEAVEKITVTPVIGLLAGISSDESDVDDSFSTGTYFGRLNNYWYQNIINTEGTGTVEVTSGMGTKGSALSPLDARTVTGSETYISDIVGCVADGANTFTFTAPDDICSVSARNANGNVSVTYDAVTGTYSLRNTSADTTIVLTAHTDANNDHICDNTGCGQRTTCIDADGNLKCDLTGCGKPMARLYSMNANADARTELVLKFYVHEELKNSLVTTVDFGSSASAEAIISGLTLDNESGFYVLTVTQPVASGEMTLPVTVSFTDGTSAVCTVVNAATGASKTAASRSVADYANAVLQSSASTEAAKNLVTALVTYGGYAQKFFHEAGYEVNVDDLAYDILGYVPSVADVDAGDIQEILNVPVCFTSVTQDAHLEAAIWQDVYFVLADGYSFVANSNGDVNLTLSYKETVNGETKTGTLVPDVDADGRYYVRIRNIPAAFLDYSYKIVGQVMKDGTTTSFEVKPSITSYLGRLLVNSNDEKQKDLAKAMWKYNQLANAFFNETPEAAETEVTA